MGTQKLQKLASRTRLLGYVQRRNGVARSVHGETRRQSQKTGGTHDGDAAHRVRENESRMTIAAREYYPTRE